MKADDARPRRTTTYLGHFTDSSRWDAFEPRADDVFICTPPKCGTTWTQAIVANLIFGRSDFEGKLADLSPWFDGKLAPLEEYLRTLAAQSHRRFIKTHTPLDGIPFFDTCQYLVVYRDPRDAYFSLRNQILNMRDPPVSSQLAEDPRQGFLAWVDTPYEPDSGDQRSLEAFTRHFLGYWRFRHLPNLHLLHYRDMQRDRRAAVERIADALAIEVSSERVSGIVDAVGFDAMKKDASRFSPASGRGLFVSDDAFFSSGRSAQWREVLGPAELDRFESRLAQLLPAAESDWLRDPGD